MKKSTSVILSLVALSTTSLPSFSQGLSTLEDWRPKGGFVYQSGLGSFTCSRKFKERNGRGWRMCLNLDDLGTGFGPDSPRKKGRKGIGGNNKTHLSYFMLVSDRGKEIQEGNSSKITQSLAILVKFECNTNSKVSYFREVKTNRGWKFYDVPEADKYQRNNLIHWLKIFSKDDCIKPNLDYQIVKGQNLMAYWPMHSIWDSSNPNGGKMWSNDQP